MKTTFLTLFFTIIITISFAFVISPPPAAHAHSHNYIYSVITDSGTEIPIDIPIAHAGGSEGTYGDGGFLYSQQALTTELSQFSVNALVISGDTYTQNHADAGISTNNIMKHGQHIRYTFQNGSTDVKPVKPYQTYGTDVVSLQFVNKIITANHTQITPVSERFDTKEQIVANNTNLKSRYNERTFNADIMEFWSGGTFTFDNTTNSLNPTMSPLDPTRRVTFGITDCNSAPYFNFPDVQTALTGTRTFASNGTLLNDSRVSVATSKEFRPIELVKNGPDAAMFNAPYSAGRVSIYEFDVIDNGPNSYYWQGPHGTRSVTDPDLKMLIPAPTIPPIGCDKKDGYHWTWQKSSIYIVSDQSFKIETATDMNGNELRSLIYARTIPSFDSTNTTEYSRASLPNGFEAHEVGRFLPTLYPSQKIFADPYTHIHEIRADALKEWQDRGHIMLLPTTPQGTPQTFRIFMWDDTYTYVVKFPYRDPAIEDQNIFEWKHLPTSAPSPQQGFTGRGNYQIDPANQMFATGWLLRPIDIGRLDQPSLTVEVHQTYRQGLELKWYDCVENCGSTNNNNNQPQSDGINNAPTSAADQIRRHQAEYLTKDNKLIRYETTYSANGSLINTGTLTAPNNDILVDTINGYLVGTDLDYGNVTQNVLYIVPAYIKIPISQSMLVSQLWLFDSAWNSTARTCYQASSCNPKVLDMSGMYNGVVRQAGEHIIIPVVPAYDTIHIQINNTASINLKYAEILGGPSVHIIQPHYVYVTDGPHQGIDQAKLETSVAAWSIPTSTGDLKVNFVMSVTGNLTLTNVFALPKPQIPPVTPPAPIELVTDDPCPPGMGTWDANRQRCDPLTVTVTIWVNGVERGSKEMGSYDHFTSVVNPPINSKQSVTTDNPYVESQSYLYADNIQYRGAITIPNVVPGDFVEFIITLDIEGVVDKSPPPGMPAGYEQLGYAEGYLIIKSGGIQTGMG